MKSTIKIAGIVASLVAVVIGSGYGYQLKKTEIASRICNEVKADLTKWQQSKTASTEELMKVIFMTENCSKALNSIPFKNSEVSERISKVDEAISTMRSAVPLMAMAEGLQNAFQPKTQNQPEVKPSPVQFEDLPLCEQLDGIAKGGKSVSEFIKNSSDIGAIETAIRSSCNWHLEQLRIATLPPSRSIVSNPPVNVPTGQFMGYASTGEAVYYRGTQGTQVSYTIGSDVVIAELACDPGFFKNVYSNGAFVQDVMYPSSEATRQVLISGCKSTDY